MRIRGDRAKNREADLRAKLSDREDLRDAVPTLDDDFHHPCPECGRELVILASQAIRRVRCAPCHMEFTLDRRIGGELCLLPFNTREHAQRRTAVENLKALKFRVIVWMSAVVLGCAFVAAMIAASGFIVLIVGFAILALTLFETRSLWQARATKHGRRFRKRRRRVSVTPARDRAADEVPRSDSPVVGSTTQGPDPEQHPDPSP